MNALPADQCFHCGLALEANDENIFWTVIDSVLQPMCCGGCAMASKLITGAGFERFYHYRTANDLQADNTQLADSESYVEFDHPEIQQAFVETENNIKTAKLAVQGMSCAACAWLLERYIKTLAGVCKVNVNLVDHRLTVSWDDTQQTLSEIMATISRLGYAPRPYMPATEYLALKAQSAVLLQRLGIAGLLMMQMTLFAVAMYLGGGSAVEDNPLAAEHYHFFRWASLLLSLPLVFYCARPFFQAAIKGLKAFYLGMDLPIALAIAIAFMASFIATVKGSGDIYFDSIAMFCFLLLLGRYLDHQVRQSSGLSSLNVSSQLPLVTQRFDAEGRLTTVPLSRLQRSDRVLVKANAVIPCDAIVVDGQSSVDEASFTGESFPRAIKAGDTVLAGTLNIDAALTLSVMAIGLQSRFAQLLNLIDRAAEEKSPIESLADSLASRFVLAVLILATFTAYYWLINDSSRWLVAVIAVLIVSCPCALSLATPVAMTVARQRLKQRGFLATHAHALEGLAQTDTVVFDKTGTLTTGDIRIHEIEVLESNEVLENIELLESIDEDELSTQERYLSIAMRLEQQSTHPIAKAFQHKELKHKQFNHKYLNTKAISVAHKSEDKAYYRHHNLGVEASIDGQHYYLGCYRFIKQMIGVDGLTQEKMPTDKQIYLYRDSEPLACFHLTDPLRDDAKATIDDLRKLGMNIILLSGDSERAVNQVANTLGIGTVFSEQSPEAKLQQVQQLQSEGKKLLLVGDGLNDVPVLAAANTSIAVANATDFAKAKADCFLLNPGVRLIPEAIVFSRRTKRIITQNISWAIAYNMLAIPCAAIGWVPPWAAAIGMSVSSLAVVFNAMRLQRGTHSLIKTKNQTSIDSIVLSKNLNSGSSY